MKTSLVVLSLLMAFVMILSGCSGNSNKPSDTTSVTSFDTSSVASSATSSDTSSDTSSVISSDTHSDTIPPENILLANNVEPRKITGYNTFEYVKVYRWDNVAVRVTFQLPYDMYGELDVEDFYYTVFSNLYILEKQTYTESDRYYLNFNLTKAEPDYIEKKLEELKTYKENMGYEYEIFDDGTILYEPVMTPGSNSCIKYFEEGYVLEISSIISDFDEELAYTIVSTAKIELVDDNDPSIKQITGEEAAYGVASKKYNNYGFSCKDWRKGEEYQIKFAIPEGVKYEWCDYSNSEYAPDICGILFSDATGYSKDGSGLFEVKIDFSGSDEYDLSDTEKYISHGNGIYSYEYVPGGEDSGAVPIRVYFKIVNKKYVAYIEQYISEKPRTGLDETEQKVLFEIFNSLSVKK